MEVINLKNKFELFNDQWSPKIVAELNGQHVKLAKVKGEFVWHNHENEDELFFVVKGILRIDFEDKSIVVNEGEMIVVPKGVNHKPIADEEVLLLLFEPTNIKHSGNVITDATIDKFDWI